MGHIAPTNSRPRRSFLFVPGTGLGMFPKALAASPDIVCVDLEDAIAPPDKLAARTATLELFRQLPDNPADCELLVRINSFRTADGLADVLAILDTQCPPPGLMLPKVKSPDEIRLLDELLESVNHPIRLQLIIETNEGLEACHEIARASSRIDAILFGGADMAAELRVVPTWAALLHARSTLVHAAAGAEIDLIDVPYLDLDDLDGLDHEAALCAELGMTGKGAIHPKQLPIIERRFSPSKEQIAQARRITEAFEKANTGLLVVDGKLIEKPVLRSQYRLLSIAARLENK
ncbi:MAG: (S)-citramalyl-CoA lyase [Gammaproteobacteria bacterium]|jgi:(S)-citramalyl-CoA lyase